MARLFGLIGNRPDLTMRVLRVHAAVLRCQPAGGASVSWGVGFFQNGEVLLRRRPSDDRPVIDPIESGIELCTEAAIGHVDEAPTGTLRAEDTQPFRYRTWLFAQAGTVHGVGRIGPRLSEHIAAFLLPNVRGDTDAELCFYLFLSQLHDAGRLDTPRNDPAAVVDSLRASLAVVDRLSAEQGRPADDLDLMVSDGEHLFAVHRSGQMAHRTLAGRQALVALPGGEERHAERLPGIDRARYTVVAAPAAPATPDWTTLPTRVIFTASREAPPTIEPV